MEENIGENLYELGLGKILRYSLKSMLYERIKIDKLDLIHVKTYALKNSVKRLQRQGKDWKKVFTNTWVGRHVDGKYAHEKILSIFSHLRNVN